MVATLERLRNSYSELLDLQESICDRFHFQMKGLAFHFFTKNGLHRKCFQRDYLNFQNFYFQKPVQWSNQEPVNHRYVVVLQKQLTPISCLLIIFAKKLHHRCLTDSYWFQSGHFSKVAKQIQMAMEAFLKLKCWFCWSTVSTNVLHLKIE